MSTTEPAGAPAPTGPLDPKLLQLFQDISNNPTDVVVGQFRGYLEDFIRVTMGTQKNWTLPVGSPLVILKDLTAETAEYVYTDEQGIQYLYCNGVAVSQTTYAALYAHVGANAFGTDAGGNFFLPDPRGRSLFFTGTHTNADLGDNDGQTEANRQAAHLHTSTGLTVTGAPSVGNLTPTVGSLAISPDPHDHTYTDQSGSATAAAGAAYSGDVSGTSFSTGTRSLSVSGAPGLTGTPGLGTLDVGGTVGAGMTGDGPAHLFIGSLLVRF